MAQEGVSGYLKGGRKTKEEIDRILEGDVASPKDRTRKGYKYVESIRKKKKEMEKA